MHLINETMGYDTGDEALRLIAATVRERLRDNDVLARLTGDRFGTLLGSCSIEDGERIAAKLCECVKALTVRSGNREHSLSLSVGVAPLSASSDTPASAVSAAEVASMSAAEKGGNRYETYVLDNTNLIRREQQMHLVATIQSALAEDHLELYCQPIVPLAAADDACHVEVLLRLLGEDGQALSPATFIPAAERYHLMPSIDRWVVDRALNELSTIADRLTDDCMISINLSGQTLGEAKFLAIRRAKSYRNTVCDRATSASKSPRPRPSRTCRMPSISSRR